MRRTALLLCAALLALSLACCAGHHGDDDFDPKAEGVVDVVVNKRPSVMSGRGESETGYYSLASGQRIREAEPFDPDPMIVYEVPAGCIVSFIDKAQNRILDRLDHMALRDENRESAPVSDEQAKIFRLVAGLEHDMTDIRFIEAGRETFVSLELNVNLWTPCCLYGYDREADALGLLHQWDAQEVVGLRVRNIALAG